ncbi:hypothetical protein BRE01_49210 [Brevibacillus reuszeri]|uniref:Uncharacterized protein n=1 Tax=Brevibacillus reuszeri TaxID=54915 RepID=A0A0K9YMX8_9BACL|nr:hypothetical protein [Brevibacillus reuszeri]KNB69520.1 hypothetical protein ADS79_27020 [Brevibacillus reuszeri]MED1856116.1 hypothetical protein [Brevibacillus reuszeri]GED71219.1 hypothetical protein BRE01_49210 [Brevibacillus reuszeri]
MTAYLGPETLSLLSVADRDIVHTALIEEARRDALTPIDLLKDKRWILATKLKRQEPVDEEELGWIIRSLRERADRTERRGMALNPICDRRIADKVTEIKQAREQAMISSIEARYKGKTACSEQTA